MNTHHKTTLFDEFPHPSIDAWWEQVRAETKAEDPASMLNWKTRDGFTVAPLYQTSSGDDAHPPALPGVPPYTRGVATVGEAPLSWRIRQAITSAEQLHVSEITRLQESGRGEAEIVLSIGTGGVGVTIDTPTGFCSILERFVEAGIPVVINAGIYSTIFFRAALASLSSASVGLISGLCNDPLEHLLLHGGIGGGSSSAFDTCADDVRCAREVSPGTSVLRVGSHVFHNAGASTSLELACTLGSGVEYLHQLATRGIAVDDACARIEFSFSAGTNIAFEIAKLRAARMLWAKIVHHFSPSDPSSLKMRIHSGGSKWSATVFDRHVNILRGTLETMAAALGGADSITTDPFDIATGDTTELSRRIALNTSMLLADEVGIARVLDPAGGSGYIEMLTQELAKSAWEKFQVIESRGGMLSSIIDGHVQSVIAREYKERKHEISKRREVFLGTSKYPDPTESGIARRSAMGGTESAELSQRTDEESRLGAFARAVEGGEDILARLQRGTLLRESVDVLLQHRGAEVFETIRFLVQQAPHRPRVLLATFGPTAWRRARAGFSSEFLGIAGFDILDHPGYENTDEIISAAMGAEVDIVVLCSDDESYPVTGVEIAQQLKRWKAGMIVLLAGNPGADPEVLKKAGVDDWINMRTDAGVFLSGLLPLLGITTPEGMK